MMHFIVVFLQCSALSEKMCSRIIIDFVLFIYLVLMMVEPQSVRSLQHPKHARQAVIIVVLGKVQSGLQKMRKEGNE